MFLDFTRGTCSPKKVIINRQTITRLEPVMPNSKIVVPVSSASTDRLAPGAGWGRPVVAGIGIGDTLNPASLRYGCFESNEE